jgi:hypothetical protein
MWRFLWALTGGIALTGALIGSCSRSAALDEAYQRIYLSMFALEFPSSKAAFDNCAQQRIQRCLDLVETARQGKDVLLMMEPEQALRRTLETITSACPDDERERQEICLGAIIALYFFREPEQDALILHAVLDADAVVRQKLLGPVPFAWHRNRPAPERWIEALGKLPNEAFPRTGKENVLKGFGSPPGPYDDGGVRLL